MQQGASDKGYTLVEILIVVTILGIVALVAIPNFSSGTEKLDLAAEEFVEAIRFARTEAIRTGNPYGFYLDTAQKLIRVFRADTSTSPPTPVYDVYHPISKKRYDIDLDAHRFAAADLLPISVSYQGVCIDSRVTIFDKQGTAFCGNPYLVVLLKGDLTFKLGNHSRVVTVYGVTGRVVIQ